MHHDNGRAVLLSFLIGAIAGAGIALLFAPHSGKKTRHRIADMAEDAREYASDSAQKLKKKIK